MAARSAERASSMMRSKRRRRAAPINGPPFVPSWFSRPCFSRSGGQHRDFSGCFSFATSKRQAELGGGVEGRDAVGKGCGRGIAGFRFLDFGNESRADGGGIRQGGKN